MRFLPCLSASRVSLTVRSISHAGSSRKELVQKQKTHLNLSGFGVELGWEYRRFEMTKKELLSRISIDPNVCFGKPCIREYRIWVSLVLDFLTSGMTSQEILKQYPGLEAADILACIAYGAEMARERYVEIPPGAET
jgi:uncharacterized protein (DUF433 family)